MKKGSFGRLWVVFLLFVSGQSVFAQNLNGLSGTIIGGVDVKSSDWIAKSTVSILDSADNSYCSATLIANDIAVTAAHCIHDSDPAYLGFSVNVTQPQLLPTSRKLAIKKAVYHPQYNPMTGAMTNLGDIGLIYFTDTLPTDYVAAEILPDNKKLVNGQLVVVAGYGLNDYEKNMGYGVLRKTTLTIDDKDFSSTEILLDSSKGTSDCSGDSGGPLFVNQNGKNYLLGADNWGDEFCKQFSVYVKINTYTKWIDDTIQVMRTP